MENQKYMSQITKKNSSFGILVNLLLFILINCDFVIEKNELFNSLTINFLYKKK